MGSAVSLSHPVKIYYESKFYMSPSNWSCSPLRPNRHLLDY